MAGAGPGSKVKARSLDSVLARCATQFQSAPKHPCTLHSHIRDLPDLTIPPPCHHHHHHYTDAVLSYRIVRPPRFSISHRRRCCTLTSCASLDSRYLPSFVHFWRPSDRRRIWTSVRDWERGTPCTFCQHSLDDFPRRSTGCTRGSYISSRKCCCENNLDDSREFLSAEKRTELVNCIYAGSSLHLPLSIAPECCIGVIGFLQVSSVAGPKERQRMKNADGALPFLRPPSPTTPLLYVLCLTALAI
jgi:hypothetical protein